MSTLEGKILKGYTIQSVIGTGGFGVVYRAHQELLKRDVAIKVILPEHANNPEFIRRFEIEAELVARLEHPGIVPLYDYWREANGAFIVMRFLRGGNLRDLIDSGILTIEQTLHFIEQVSLALSYAHRHNIVHRDIKPDNILLDEDGNAYVTDFGIAKSLDVQTATEHQGMTGTAQYVSPEQIQSQAINSQSDIYSMGVMLYEMLAGKHPYSDLSLSQIIFKHLQEPLPDLHIEHPNYPSELTDIIHKATAKDVAERYQHVTEMINDINAIFDSASQQTAAIDVEDTDEGLVDLVNPFKGLRAFRETDAGDFYGRNELIERLLQRLRDDSQTARFLAVVGPSGSGKSSVVKAGLLPTLRSGKISGSENWFIAEIFPGPHPFEELEIALLRLATRPISGLMERLKRDERGIFNIANLILPDDDSELVLLIDQFEEVFTLVEDESIRELFINSLLEVVTNPRSRFRVIVTLRADFYDQPLRYLEFGELLRKRMETVLPLTKEELELSIQQPIQQVGARIEAGLLETIVNDVGNQPGTLPLLQYALTELFERRSGRTLTLKAYQEIGGVTGALARRADEIYDGVTESQQEIIRQLFLRLVTLGEGTEDTRRRVRITELADNEALKSIIKQFGQYRLLTFDRDPINRVPTVEVAHEALIRTWERLKNWIQDSRDELRVQRRLTAATNEWLEADRAYGFLATASRLEQFEEWANYTDLALNPNEQDYILQSLRARDEQRRIDEERKAYEAELEQRAVNRLRTLVIALTIFLLGAIGLSLFAFDRQSQAVSAGATSEYNAQLAADARDDALSNAGTATIAQGEAIIQADNALTSEAIAQVEADNAQTQAAIAATAQFFALEQADLAATAQFSALEQADIAYANFIDASHQRAISLAGKALEELNDNHDPQKALLLGLEAMSDHPEFTNDEAVKTLIEILGYDLRVVADHTFSTPIDSIHQSSLGGKFAVVESDHDIFIWDMNAPDEQNYVYDSPEDVYVSSSSPDPSIAWNALDTKLAVGTGQVLEGRTGTPVPGIHRTSSIHIINVETRLEEQFIRLELPPRKIEFSPDGNHLLIITGISTETRLRLFDLETEQAHILLRMTGEPRLHTEFSSDGQYLAFGGGDTDLVIWQMDSDVVSLEMDNSAEVLRGLNWHPTLNRLLVWTSGNSNENSAYVIDADKGEIQLSLPHASLPDDYDFLEQSITSFSDVERYHFDEIEGIEESARGIVDATWSPSGEFIMSATLNEIYLWNSNTGELFQNYLQEDAHIYGVRWDNSDTFGIALLTLRSIATANGDALQISPIIGSSPQSLTQDRRDLKYFSQQSSTGNVLMLDTEDVYEVTHRLLKLELPDKTFDSEGFRWSHRDNHLYRFRQGNFSSPARLELWAISEDASLNQFTTEEVWLGSTWGESGSYVLSWTQNGKVQLANAVLNEISYTVDLNEPVTDVKSFGLLDDKPQKWLAITSNNRILVYESETRISEIEHDTKVIDAYFDKSGERIVSWSEDHKIILTSSQTGERIHSFTHEDWIGGVVWDMNDSLMLSWSDDRTARVWDTRSGELQYTLNHDSTILGARWHPDSIYIATWSLDTSLKIWDSQTGDLILSHQQPDILIGGVDWIPDGSLFYFWSPNDNTIRFWNINGEETQILRVSGRGVFDIEISKSAGLWNIRNTTGTSYFYDADNFGLQYSLTSGDTVSPTGLTTYAGINNKSLLNSELRIFDPFYSTRTYQTDDAVVDVDWSSDGDWIALTTLDEVLIFPVGVDALLTAAQKLVIRDLTRDELESAFLATPIPTATLVPTSEKQIASTNRTDYSEILTPVDSTTATAQWEQWIADATTSVLIQMTQTASVRVFETTATVIAATNSSVSTLLAETVTYELTTTVTTYTPSPTRTPTTIDYATLSSEMTGTAWAPFADMTATVRAGFTDTPIPIESYTPTLTLRPTATPTATLNIPERESTQVSGSITPLPSFTPSPGPSPTVIYSNVEKTATALAIILSTSVSPTATP